MVGRWFVEEKLVNRGLLKLERHWSDNGLPVELWVAITVELRT